MQRIAMTRKRRAFIGVLGGERSSKRWFLQWVEISLDAPQSLDADLDVILFSKAAVGIDFPALNKGGPDRVVGGQALLSSDFVHRIDHGAVKVSEQQIASP